MHRVAFAGCRGEGFRATRTCEGSGRRDCLGAEVSRSLAEAAERREQSLSGQWSGGDAVVVAGVVQEGLPDFTDVHPARFLEETSNPA